jgi:hypothetical protein
MVAHMTRVQNRLETPTPRKVSDTKENQVTTNITVKHTGQGKQTNKKQITQ